MGMIFFVIIMLHLLIGFGYVMYKLNSKKKVGDKESGVATNKGEDFSPVEEP